MASWSNRRVVVTGGASFLGSFVVERLRKTSWCREVFAPRSREYDLREKEAVVRMYTDFRPHIVIYLLPVNLYGPGDNFDPDSSHVIPALIKKCLDAIEEGLRRTIEWYRTHRGGIEAKFAQGARPTGGL
jgi:nucleoside-diphosphate-sugar epimerase